MSKRPLLALLLASAVGLVPNAWAELHFSGYARSYNTMLLRDPPTWGLLQNTLALSLDEQGEGRGIRSDLLIYQRNGQGDLELNLQQLYLDLLFQDFDIRLGRQQIIWGKADGAFITDVVSPKDLREFLLPDFAEIRQGIDALTFNKYFGAHTLTAVFAPAFRPTRAPDSGSIWLPTLPLAGEAPLRRQSALEVEPRPGNSEIYGRWSALLGSLDFEIVGAWMWDDDPVLHLERYAHLEPLQGMIIDSIFVQPQYHRLAMGGGALSTSVGGVVVKAEGAYFKDKRFQSLNPLLADGVAMGDYLHGMTGISGALHGVDLGAQYIAKWLVDYQDSFVEEELQQMATFLARYSLLRETLHLEFFAYAGLQEPDALLRPSVGYDVTDGLLATLGANIFLGDRGSFGQYNRNDMAYAKVNYFF